jgi:hypothetical protein
MNRMARRRGTAIPAASSILALGLLSVIASRAPWRAA